MRTSNPKVDSAHRRRSAKTDAGRAAPFVEPNSSEDILPFNDQFAILIHCDSEQQQAALLERLTKEGLRCRSLIV